MPTPKMTDAQCMAAVNAMNAANGNKTAAARALGVSRNTIRDRIHEAVNRGMISEGDAKSPQSHGFVIDQAAILARQEADKPLTVDPVALRRALRNGQYSLADLAEVTKTNEALVVEAIDSMRREGYSILDTNGIYWLNTNPQAASLHGPKHTYTSRPDGTYVFGFTSDNHLGSKYARLDVLNALFKEFEAVGVDRVLNAGNWIDGEATFNKHDLIVRGMDGQCQYLAQKWPRIEGVKTYAVAGDDHEGWYCQREGVDIGRYAEMCFRDADRDDWIDLGYMEADISLVHAVTGVRNKIRVAHPGGGSAYATSYAPQKYIESLDGGEKPGVVLLGHWHKMEFLNIRNVWTIQTGCTQDQTPFGRKKRLDFHVGGGICRLRQDPETGAIYSCTVELLRFFNRDYYGSGRWSHHGDVKMAERSR